MTLIESWLVITATLGIAYLLFNGAVVLISRARRRFGEGR